MSASYRVHRLIQDLNRDARLATAFRADPDSLLRQYALAEDECVALRAGTPEALIRLGVHPNLQMKFLRIRRAPAGVGPGPLDSYLRDLQPGK